MKAHQPVLRGTSTLPEFVGTTWGDSGLYALALKRELRICKGRLDEVISWRQNATRKQ
ncbi:Rz1-like lysis system protein LysC [Yersinia sp. 2544 StPb PI]|uniref:Rz1-like lysis system protein LysC n=1 Tax=unclassified Yersinia (in: enterobacteria) TaxID=2653513 RepID=UPI003B280071